MPLRDMLAAAVEQASDSVLIMDRTGTILYANPAFCVMTGYQAEELIGTKPPRAASDDHGHYQLWKAIDGACAWSGAIASFRRGGEPYQAQATVTPIVDVAGNVTSFLAVERDITEEVRNTATMRRLAAAVDHASDLIVITDADGILEYVNPAFLETMGIPEEALVGEPMPRSDPELGFGPGFDEMHAAIAGRRAWSGMVTAPAGDGRVAENESTLSPIRNEQGEVVAFVGVSRNRREQRELEEQLRNAQKLESIGELAAGIAHEINTPTQYVSDNTRFLQDGFESLLSISRLAVRMAEEARAGTVTSETLAATERAMADADVTFLLREIPSAIHESLEGLERVATIVRAMKDFSHPASEMTAIDLNQAIRSTITVASNEWKYVADMEVDLDPDLPLVTCLPGEVNQVVLNIVVNAAQAIREGAGDGGARGTIRVTSALDDDHVELRIADTGPGIPDTVRDRVFDPFFTTKEVGKGTGQGLAISHSVIVNKHGGTLTFETEAGEGTTFVLRLPIVGRQIANVA